MHAEKLQSARAEVTALAEQLTKINQDIQRADAGVTPIQQAASAAQSLKQQRRGLFARMLRLGKIDTKSTEVRDLSLQIATAEASAEQAAAVIEAHRDLVAELQQQAQEAQLQLPAAHRALAEAQFEAAAEEIRSEALPEFLAACETFRLAYGRLAGLGSAHCQMAQDIRAAHGVTVGPLGTELPVRSFDVIAIGFGLAEAHAFNVKRIDASEAIREARNLALLRWRAA